jgi:hypothetical protein
VTDPIIRVGNELIPASQRYELTDTVPAVPEELAAEVVDTAATAIRVDTIPVDTIGGGTR